MLTSVFTMTYTILWFSPSTTFHSLSWVILHVIKKTCKWKKMSHHSQTNNAVLNCQSAPARVTGMNKEEVFRLTDILSNTKSAYQMWRVWFFTLKAKLLMQDVPLDCTLHNILTIVTSLYTIHFRHTCLYYVLIKAHLKCEHSGSWYLS